MIGSRFLTSGTCLGRVNTLGHRPPGVLRPLKGLEVNKEIKTFLAAYPNWAEVVEGTAHAFEFEIRDLGWQ